MLVTRDSDLEIVSRPRVVERIATAAQRPVALILAAAGYGKSYALREYLQTLDGEHVLLDATCGFDVSNLPVAYRSTIAVDGLERASEAAKAKVLERIEQTKRTARWIIASRSSIGLPLGTWLADGDCELPLSATDLRFNNEEVERACRSHGLAIEDDVVREVLDCSEGWPVGVSLMLRALKHSTDRREARAIVRDASFDYLSEQVYSSLCGDERELLAVAAVSSEVDLRVLELAGFPNAVQVIESIRRRTGLLHDDDRGFAMSSLQRDFLRRQTALAGAHERDSVNTRAGHALESAGRMEGALNAFVAARSKPDVLRVLEENGFDLIECGHGASVAQAIDTIDETTRSTSPRILALRGVLQSIAGKPIRAETFLRRALAHSQGDSDVAGFAGLRLAPLIANYGGDVTEILRPLTTDPSQKPATRAEALSLLAVAHASAGQGVAASQAVRIAERLLLDVSIESTRARVLQRIGVASMYICENENARRAFTQAGDLASELDLHSIASRSWSALANLMCHAYDDVVAQLWHAERAAEAARRSGDLLELQTAVLQMVAAEMRRGNAEESEKLEEQLSAIQSDPTRVHLLTALKAVRLAWSGRFSEAHQTLTVCWERMHYEFDRIMCGAQCALFLALDGRRERSVNFTGKVLAYADGVRAAGLFHRRRVALALLLCVAADTVNQRVTAAAKAAHRIGTIESDDVVKVAFRIAEEYSRYGVIWRSPDLEIAYDRLRTLGHADVAQLLEVACKASAMKADRNSTVTLTPAELSVLLLLAEGLSTKEIAAREGRSIYTVRAHIANAIGKLKCGGRTQALAAARRLKIIP